MTDSHFSLVFIEGIRDRILAGSDWQELEGPAGGAYLPLTQSDAPDVSAGAVQLWQAGAGTSLDRMVHMRLIAGPAETQLLFVFGLADSCMPHLHVQAVQFPPDGCVYNADLLPRLDAIDYPEYFQRAFTGLRRPYKKAVGDAENSCAQAPANPALAVYMSPWGIASGRTDQAELDRVAPQIDEYVDHYLGLAAEGSWAAPVGVDLAARDQRHLQVFFSDELDPRAWHGVYKIVGEGRGKVIKRLLKTPLYT